MTLKANNNSNNSKQGKKTTFSYFAPHAQQAQLAGTFNDWDPTQSPMKKNKKGEWKVSLSLPPGRYEYRYLVDGNWQNDQQPVECAPNTFGSWNCTIEVQ